MTVPHSSTADQLYEAATKLLCYGVLSRREFADRIKLIYGTGIKASEIIAQAVREGKITPNDARSVLGLPELPDSN